jgi:thiamine-monophosphate kinase
MGVRPEPRSARENPSGGTELERVRMLADVFGRSGSPDELGELELAIGDDAAVLCPHRGSRLVWTVDAQAEDVHFRRAWISWRDLGYRSFVAAASDVSAMGGSPWCALSALTLTQSIVDLELLELAEGQREAANALGARVLGGNLSKGEVVTITTTVLGKATRPIVRSGAKPGDGLWAAGDLGLAAAGLAALERGVTDGRVELAVDAWRRPKHRVKEGLAMVRSAHAAIDVSDGLALDAARIGEASGVSVILEEELLLSRAGDRLARAAEVLEANLLELILGGGEDYALLAASEVPIEGFSRIGEIREGRGVMLRGKRGDEPLRDLHGFDHFSKG